MLSPDYSGLPLCLLRVHKVLVSSSLTHWVVCCVSRVRTATQHSKLTGILGWPQHGCVYANSLRGKFVFLRFLWGFWILPKSDRSVGIQQCLSSTRWWGRGWGIEQLGKKGGIKLFPVLRWDLVGGFVVLNKHFKCPPCKESQSTFVARNQEAQQLPLGLGFCFSLVEFRFWVNTSHTSLPSHRKVFYLGIFKAVFCWSWVQSWDFPFSLKYNACWRPFLLKALCSAALVLECLGAPLPQQKQEDLAVGFLSAMTHLFWQKDSGSLFGLGFLLA